jgi:hypothetical protein
MGRQQEVTQMTRTVILGAALGILLTPVMSRAETPAPLRVISPIFGQLVMFSMPANFVAVTEGTKGAGYIREAVLKGETTERWTQMITVTGAKGAAGNPAVSPQSFAASIAGGFKAACPGTFAAKGLGETRFGDHDAFVAVAGCGRVEASADKHSETALIAVVKGRSDYYTLQWAERSASVDSPAIDDAKWQQRMRLLQPIRLCPIVPGEAAPYPSCVGKN